MGNKQFIIYHFAPPKNKIHQGIRNDCADRDDNAENYFINDNKVDNFSLIKEQI